jgi:hypothetical protein
MGAQSQASKKLAWVDNLKVLSTNGFLYPGEDYKYTLICQR